MWIPPEVKDPVVRHFPGRKSIGYFGAVRLRDGLFVATREPDKFNAQSFHNFMKKLLVVGSTPGRKMVLITDNAKYHHAKLHREWREEHADRFVLYFLPPLATRIAKAQTVG